MSPVGTLTVPGEFADSLRVGVRRAVFDDVGVEIEALVCSEEPREEIMRRYTLLLGRLNSARTLLDQIGWRARGAQADVEVDLDIYGALALQGLRAQLARETSRPRDASESLDDDASEWVRALRDFVAILDTLLEASPSTPDWTAGLADIIGCRIAYR